MTCRNEADIIESSIRHLLAEGIDLVLLADGRSTDGTRDILQDLKETGQVQWYDDDKAFHDQPFWTNALASIAHDHGAEWIIAADADEFWIGSDGRSLAEVILSQPPEVGKLYAPMYQHHDWDRREAHAKTFPKVAYRWCGSARVRPGNHDVDEVEGSERWGEIEIREMQYRSFEHFVRKVHERNATIDPSLPWDAGWHHRKFADFTEDQLRAEWDTMCAVPTIYDPIP